MNLDDLSCRDIQYVLALAEHRHFGHAAAACAVSQPALSKQIAQLENHLGITLFERTKRTVKLTPLGQRFVEKAQSFWQTGIALLDVAQQHGQFAQMPWKVGIIASVCPYVLPLVLPDITQQLPHLSIVEGMTDDLILRLKTGELDMVWAAATVTDSHLNTLPFYWERFYIATTQPSRYPNPIPAQYALNADRLILLKEGHCLTDQTLGLCGTAIAVTPVRAQQLDTVLHMAANHLGDAVIPALAVNSHTALRYIPFETEGRQLVLFTRRTSDTAAQLAHHFVTHWGERLQQAAQSI